MKIFDTHLHIINPTFPLYENQGYLPDAFTCEDYLHAVSDLNVVGGAIVSGSFQQFDQCYLIDALQNLGENFFGVTQLPYDTKDDDIIKLNELGVKALRFNVNRGGSEDISRLDYFARRVHELVNWHTELYINGNDLPAIIKVVEKLPAVSIDHLGLSKAGLPNLFNLVDKGVRVKATGFGRIDFNADEAIRAIYAINPDALMFGTDLPSTRAKRPFQYSDIERIKSCLGEEAAQKVLYKNALDWYSKS
ncbi:amidohydrolase family protein [Lysinibacillus parviboronicapiens]|uniref:amidohydrolase family protein n=1 Tax=Lysinibacillus parviboronicapiens TaxID=436516 RepID=UPI000D38513B|nr:amidohydrolase family protein [Lysinibacillus parviboronicapiens]